MPAPARDQVTRLLDRIGDGGAEGTRAADLLLPLVYEELRRLARARLGRERPGPTLQATALVHDAYLRLVADRDPGWQGKAHFFGAAALAMRRILVERARAHGRLRRGGGRERVTLGDDLVPVPGPEIDLLALDEALERLKRQDERRTRVVELRYFAGLELAEIAQALEVSLGTVKNDWAYARSWLHRELSRTGGSGAEHA